MNKNRPVNLDISTIKLPAAALVSILHRISGVVLFAVVALLLCMLDASLESEQGFADVAAAFDSIPAKLILWAALAALIYHLVAGVRHLLMDLGIGETLEGGRRGAVMVLVVAVVLILLAGVWIW
ncbi:succinate dehydrogenase, cytochrome b556 subunit [Microbulbifer thermotolerans]|uniref:Succinate dehydrogenase cytochrome b556 subunit n=1 Tax=Microbulbifer thermotolerans TaxID=252514 RepID=A0A143HKP7_MICTH|nr:succinate dehydrogenase, cytochrome b556 subunit [Microbulbifer thermotolerans]AMX02087.1 succinate dehydrogenase, cytochrome b556 subunit [Microbulbifer thermotolerans]MCX2778957.1 succinate dehydrogenase, cytochrome b556 subunit [Microbulbifer thermotolerans]MCX2781411.1 succinate dehydrogenase, cytochrome b556 subunit [Microbulbifer thermotolerans]MCX2793842.1 succinate dehydrogenase, cytochrome b556 subunit [Microbulbifer thermotolerans]MCX2802403.1 succinate dehydrogenase, cytochrome b